MQLFTESNEYLSQEFNPADIGRADNQGLPEVKDFFKTLENENRNRKTPFQSNMSGFSNQANLGLNPSSAFTS